MNSVLGNGIFGSNQNPADQMRQQLEIQMAQYQKMQQAQQQQQGSSGLLEEFKNLIASLNEDEQKYLIETNDFKQAKQIYETGFFDFLGSKFSADYLATPIGKQTIENLTETTKNLIKHIKEATKEKNQTIEALAALAAEDPEIQRKLQDKLKEKFKDNGKS